MNSYIMKVTAMSSTLQYQYEANLVFTKITEGIYKVYKDKRDLYGAGTYMATPSVVTCLNKSYLKVAIYDERQVFIHANFELKGDETNA
jgi:hypothetical protein